MQFIYGRRPIDHQPSERQREIARTLLDASKRLGAMNRRRLQIDLADLALKAMERHEKPRTSR